jgi:phosphopantothenate-cysteine ligase
LEAKNFLEKFNNKILYIEFTYIEDYLFKYEFFCRKLNSFGKNAIIFLAAAVSDYYIPEEKISEHKIQSTVDILNIELFPVKKEM